VEFNPVVIGGATIRFCTGHHANNIEGKKIGPGAVVVIRRSGDVIPYLENVLVPCKNGGQMPEPGTWVYDENRVHAMDIRDGEDNVKKAQTLCHTLQVFELEGISDKTCLKLVEGGVITLLDIINASEKSLEGLIGPALAKKCKTSLQSLLEKASPEQWIRAWTQWPRGFGPTRIQAFLQAQPKVEQWHSITSLPGLSADSIGDVRMCVPDYLAWRKPYEGFMNKEATVATPVVPRGPAQGYVVFSGFRSKELETLFTNHGWIIQDGINKQTTALVVQDATKETSKTKAARSKNIRIVAVDDVQHLFEK
jgi:NAD-dependent DNA ligase